MKTSFRFATGLALLFALVLGFFGRAAAQTTDTAPDPIRYCQGEAATIVYIGYDFTISGTDDADVIYIEGGWNYVYADGGDDKVCIFGHFNTIYGGDGDDILAVGGLYNELYGDDGDDALQADSATNILNGDVGDDLCNGDGC
jgi:Ca2+-binding RTX toxin-like protein